MTALSRISAASAALGAVLAWGSCVLPGPVAAAREPDTACAVAAQAPAGPQPSAQYSEYRTRLHSFATGAGVKVAVIDTGVAAHPQLHVSPGSDFVTPEEPDPLRDCDLHGTVVASEAERAGSGTLASLAAAIEDAVNADAKVINVSVVSCVPQDAAARVDRAGVDAALRRAEEAGAVVVAASGNATAGGCEKDDVVFPAEAETVLAVGALATPHDLAEYSIAAPLSAEGNVPLALEPGGGWATGKGDATFQGTSFAAPLVSGTLALLVQRYPGDSPAQLRQRIIDSAEPGHGVVDPLTAVTYRPPSDSRKDRSIAVAPAAASKDTSWPQVRLLLGALGMLILVAVFSAQPLRPPRGLR